MTRLPVLLHLYTSLTVSLNLQVLTSNTLHSVNTWLSHIPMTNMNQQVISDTGFAGRVGHWTVLNFQHQQCHSLLLSIDVSGQRLVTVFLKKVLTWILSLIYSGLNVQNNITKSETILYFSKNLHFRKQTVLL